MGENDGKEDKMTTETDNGQTREWIHTQRVELYLTTDTCGCILLKELGTLDRFFIPTLARDSYDKD